MTNHALILERLTRVAPFGVRFWDPVSGRTVSDDLHVVAYSPTAPLRRLGALPNRSGVYVLHHMPGLEAFTYGAGDATFWENLPPPRPYMIEVSDLQRRFHSVAFAVEAPVRGVFSWEDPSTSPPTSAQPAVPLYSAPTRSAPSGMAVVRADVWDERTGSPAAWAVLDARLEGRLLVRGLADEQGRVALIFPYPEPLRGSLSSPLGSPPGGGQRPFLEQSWPLQLHAFYSPRTPAPLVPRLEDVLTQTPATVLTSASPPVVLPEVNLPFGKELIVKSQSHSTLLLIPAGSPP